MGGHICEHVEFEFDAEFFVLQSLLMQNDWASENLQVIRTLMERSAVYRRALAPVMGLVGATGIAAGIVGASLGFETSRLFAAYWGAVALVCLTEALLLVRRQAVKELEPFWSPPTRRMAQAVSPAFFAALVVGVVFFLQRVPTESGFAMASPWSWKHFLVMRIPPENGFVMVLVAIWMVLYGLAMHAAGFFMRRGVRIFGWGYVLAGVACLAYWMCHAKFFLAQPDFPLWNSNIAMGALFGGGHAAYGLYLYVTEKRGNVA